MLTKEQREMRRSGIGASEIAMVAGLAPASWGGPLKVWKSKVEAPPAEPEETNDAIDAGVFIEDGVARWYAAREGVRLSARGKTERHSTIPWMLCTPDRFVVTNGGKNQKRVRLVQIKVAQSDDGYGEEGSDQIPTLKPNGWWSRRHQTREAQDEALRLWETRKGKTARRIRGPKKAPRKAA